MDERLFKVLDENGASFHSGHGQWSLPQNDKPGDWMPPIEGELVPCQNGYHLCREQNLIQWFGLTIWAVEYRGERLNCDDKIVVREARLLRQYTTWNECTARLFACDCAERVVHLCGDDDRPRNAIEVARRYANGKATDEELAAARAAAWAAAGAAAWAAAWDAAWAAARAAARDAARDAAWAAAWAAAWDAERVWQTARLMEYLDVQG